MRVNSFHPTTNQKRVIAKIAASPTPTVAAGEISNDVNIVAARNELAKLGVITFNQNEASLTSRGAQIAVDENITDESGQLTPDGEALAYTNSDDQPEAQPGSEPGSTAPMESSRVQFALLKELLY